MEYTKEQLEEMVSSLDWRERYKAAIAGYGLGELIHDIDSMVRGAAAMRMYPLDVLVDYPDENVRAEVAEVAARDGRLDLLERLLRDESAYVRGAVANLGYGLEVLLTDGDGYVRMCVLNQGYGLEQLVDDPVWMVRETARAKLEEMKGKSVDAVLEDARERVSGAVPCDGLNKFEIGRE